MANDKTIKHEHLPGQSCDECRATGELYIHGKCHINSPLEASVKGDVLTINCFTCKKLIVKFVVSPSKG